jgi:uncharacterized damage-inducible protein DinB
MEPWLTGSEPHPHPILRAVLHSFEQVREDARRFTEGATATAAVTFQLRHMAGSVERLTAYACGDSLTEAQIAAVANEGETGASLAELLDALDTALTASEARLRTIDLTDLAAPRFVGRAKLPTTLGGLLVHLAEHTQRHLGELIVHARAARPADKA